MFTLHLEQQDIVTVQEALAVQPLGKVLNTFLRIQQQIGQQQAAEAHDRARAGNGIDGAVEAGKV